MVTSWKVSAVVVSFATALAACGQADEPASASSEQDLESAHVVASFGEAGTATHTVPSMDLARVTELADGKILVASCNALLRLDHDGKIDPTFGEAGIASVPDGVGCATTVVLANGGVVVAGKAPITVDWSDPVRPKVEEPLTIVKLDADGKRDASFAPEGTMRLFSTALGVTMKDTDVAADRSGRVYLFARPVRRIVRLAADGKVDSTFGDRGGLSAPVKPNSELGVHTAFALSEDRIFVSQDYWHNNVERVLEIRSFDLDGVKDSSFGTDGVVKRPYGPAYYHWYTRELLPVYGGGVVAVLVSQGESETRPTVVREIVAFDAAGQLDPRVASEEANDRLDSYAFVDGAVAYPDRLGVLLHRVTPLSRPNHSWDIADANGGLSFRPTAYHAFGGGSFEAVGFGAGATYVVTRVPAPMGEVVPRGSASFAVTKLER